MRFNVETADTLDLIAPGAHAAFDGFTWMETPAPLLPAEVHPPPFPPVLLPRFRSRTPFLSSWLWGSRSVCLGWGDELRHGPVTDAFFPSNIWLLGRRLFLRLLALRPDANRIAKGAVADASAQPRGCRRQGYAPPLRSRSDFVPLIVPPPTVPVSPLCLMLFPAWCAVGCRAICFF